MSNKTAIAVALLAATSQSASAQGITGGSLGVEWGAPTDLEDLGSTTYRGAIEYGITRDFSASFDLSGYKFNNVTTDGASATLHGVYHLSESASLGVFVGADNANSATQTLYGIEGGTEFMGGTIEGYAGLVDATERLTILGAEGEYAFQQGFSAIGSFDITSAGGGDGVSRYAIGGQYQMENGPSFFAEIGQTSVDASGVNVSDTFIGLGATVAFGNGRGTTFGARSAFETTSGF